MSAENENRVRVKALVYLMPGIHLRQLQRMMGTSLNTVRYHVEAMSRSGEVMCEKDGKYCRLFPEGFDDREKRTYTALRTTAARSLVVTLLKSPRLTNKQLADVTGLAESTVSKTLSNLVHLRIVRKSFSPEQKVGYELENANQIETILAKTNKIMGVAAERFLALWDF